MVELAQVVVDVPTMQTNQPYTYQVPVILEKKLQVGMRVVVPFGNGHRQVQGFVVGFTDSTDYAGKLKPIQAVMDLQPVVNQELLALSKWLADTTYSFWIACLYTMLPNLLKGKSKRIVRVIDDEDGITLRARIVSVSKDDVGGDPGSVSVTIANKPKDIAGSISDLQSRALIGETYAQGATNQQVYNFADNADADHPATMRLYIDESTVRINKMLLTLEFEPFRAFERATGGGGGQTTSSGGGQTTSSGGGSTTSSGGGSTTSSGGSATSSATSLEMSNVLPNQTNG